MTYARLETMRVPVLVLTGDADLLSPPALVRLPAANIPDRHAAFWEEAEIWNRLVLEFIGRDGRL